MTKVRAGAGKCPLASTRSSRGPDAESTMIAKTLKMVRPKKEMELRRRKALTMTRKHKKRKPRKRNLMMSKRRKERRKRRRLAKSRKDSDRKSMAFSWSPTTAVQTGKIG